MKTLRRCALAALPLLCLSPLLAADSSTRSERVADAEGTRAYWTPERLAGARAVRLLTADLGAAERPERSFAASASSEGDGSGPRAPSAGRLPDFERFLFDPDRFRGSWKTRELISQPKSWGSTARGTGGLFYTSSRLVPEDARVVYPYSAVGKLYFSIGGSDFICSAAVISARVVGTAGHCVYSEGRFHRNFLFVPAYHRANAPYGEWTVAEVFTTEAWADGDDEVPNASDYGMLLMEDVDGERIGDVTGWLGFKTNQLSPNTITILGYPANLDRGERMHQTVSSDWDAADPATGSIVYGSDMGGGASGGPWVMNFGQKASGQNRGRYRLDNRVVGHSSFGSSDPNYLVLGSSPLDRSYREVFDEACSSDSRNCQKKTKPRKPRN